MSEKKASLELNATYVQFDSEKGLLEEIPASFKEFGSFDTGIEVPQEIIQVIEAQRENVKTQVLEQDNEYEDIEQKVNERKDSIRELMNSRDDGMTR